MFSRIKYQNKSVYLKFILIEIQGKIKSLQKKEIDSVARKKCGKGHSLFSPSQNSRIWTTCSVLALYHGSILTQQTWMKLIQRLNLNLK